MDLAEAKPVAVGWLVHKKCGNRAFLMDKKPIVGDIARVSDIIEDANGRPVHPGAEVRCPHCGEITPPSFTIFDFEDL